MDRLTVNDLNKVCYDLWELCGMDSYCTKGCHEEGGCKKGCPVLKMYLKLAEYEDFEEIFRSKMTDAACEFLKDKEEFAKWLDRNKWIAKKCDEYARAEEQGKLLKLPVAVGDMTYYVSKFDRRVIDSIVQRIEVDADGFWVITSSGTHSFDDFGKTVFLVKESAEAALKEMSE